MEKQRMEQYKQERARVIMRYDRKAEVEHNYIPKSVAEKVAEEGLLKKGKAEEIDESSDKENMFRSPPGEKADERQRSQSFMTLPHTTTNMTRNVT